MAETVATLAPAARAKPEEMPAVPAASLDLFVTETESGRPRLDTAGEFASGQQVTTPGQVGYGYFSKVWDDYSETSPSDSPVALWAYRRGKNGALGNGNRIPARIFTP